MQTPDAFAPGAFCALRGLHAAKAAPQGLLAAPSADKMRRPRADTAQTAEDALHSARPESRSGSGFRRRLCIFYTARPENDLTNAKSVLMY